MFFHCIGPPMTFSGSSSNQGKVRSLEAQILIRFKKILWKLEKNAFRHWKKSRNEQHTLRDLLCSFLFYMECCAAPRHALESIFF